MCSNIEEVDVLVCGGGPVGLLTAYGLLRAGVSPLVVEKDVKSEMPMYGRACGLYPRSLELLDSYELLHPITQVGFINRGAVTYNGRDRVTTRGWHLMLQHISGSFFDYTVNLRLKYQEEIFQDAYEKAGGRIVVGWKITQITFDSTTSSPYKVTVSAENIKSGETTTIKSKYVVGADGVHSTVRQAAGIAMPREGGQFHWVRVDALIDTDLPDVNCGTGSLESPTHGNVLLARLDHGRTRIGFSLTPELAKKYGHHMTQEQAVHEATEAVKPWKCDIKHVDWYTCYGIQQAVAENFMRGPALIAGDAGHTHSSGAAQGMNTGIHDATNLAWKLAGVIKGRFDPSILETYDSERRPVANQLIALDKKFSAVISGEVPDQYKGTSVDPNQLFAQIFEESMQFTIGLGISYDSNMLNKSPKASMTVAGHRAVDEFLYAPGFSVPTRLLEICRNDGRFNIVVFVGQPLKTKPLVHALRAYLDESSASIVKLYPGAFRFLTVMVGNSVEGEAELGCKRFGDLWFDLTSTAHYAYGVTPEVGAIVVVRPDGIVGYATTLDGGDDLSDYFGGFMKTG